MLSTGGQGWEATAAIDGEGNSLALWDERTTQDQIWSRSKASGGNWGSVTEILPGPDRQPLYFRRSNQLGRDSRPGARGAIKAARGQPIARPLPHGIVLNLEDPWRVKSEFCDERTRRCSDSLDRGWLAAKEHHRFCNGRPAACRRSLDGTTDSRKRRASLLAIMFQSGRLVRCIVTWETYNAVCRDTVAR